MASDVKTTYIITPLLSTLPRQIALALSMLVYYKKRLGSIHEGRFYRPHSTCIDRDLFRCKCHTELVGLISSAELLANLGFTDIINVPGQGIQHYSTRAEQMVSTDS